MARGSDTLKWVLTQQVTRGSALLILCGRYTFRYRFHDKIRPLQTLRRGEVGMWSGDETIPPPHRQPNIPQPECTQRYVK